MTMMAIHRRQSVGQTACSPLPRESLMSSSCLAGQKHPSVSALICLKYRTCKEGSFCALNMKIKSSIIFADTVDAFTATFKV